MTKVPSLDEEVLSLTQDVFHHMETLVQDEYDKDAAFRSLSGKFLAHFTSALIHASLTSLDGLEIPKAERLEFTEQSFTDMKRTIQNGISIGFMKAVSVFSGQVLQYWCNIEPVGDPINEDEI